MLTVEQEIELEVQVREELKRLEAEAEDETIDPDLVKVDVAIGRLSRLDSMQMEEIRKDATRRRNMRIHLLRESLKRMDAGEYGVCGQCGDGIAFERLEQTPEAILCSDCA